MARVERLLNFYLNDLTTVVRMRLICALENSNLQNFSAIETMEILREKIPAPVLRNFESKIPENLGEAAEKMNLRLIYFLIFGIPKIKKNFNDSEILAIEKLATTGLYDLFRLVQENSVARKFNSVQENSVAIAESLENRFADAAKILGLDQQTIRDRLQSDSSVSSGTREYPQGDSGVSSGTPKYPQGDSGAPSGTQDRLKGDSGAPSGTQDPQADAGDSTGTQGHPQADSGTSNSNDENQIEIFISNCNEDFLFVAEYLKIYYENSPESDWKVKKLREFLENSTSNFNLHRNSIVTELRRVLECWICENLMKNPKTLPCLHSFCQNCLETFENRKEPSAVPGTEKYCKEENFSENFENIRKI